MAQQVKPIPDGVSSITPHIVCDGAISAIEFYKKAFNASELFRLDGPDGKLMHACIQIGNSKVMMADEFPEWGSLGPKALKGSPVTLHLYVEDADKAFAQAINAGATVKMPLANMFWGDRYGMVTDPFGHQWSIATHIKDVSVEEMQASAGEGCVEIKEP
ncbi:MAG TPA: VOC family protein [Methylotenera sp.]|nr:VOC family protein [Methylotenera sp.]